MPLVEFIAKSFKLKLSLLIGLETIRNTRYTEKHLQSSTGVYSICQAEYYSKHDYKQLERANVRGNRQLIP